MKLSTKSVFLFIFLSAASPSFGQMPSGRNSVSAGWEASFPAGGKQFLTEPHFTGFSLDYAYRLTPVLALGADIGYIHADDAGEMRVLYNGDITDGYAEKKLTAAPVALSLRYYPLGRKPFAAQPYVSASGGMQYTEYAITGSSINKSETSGWSALAGAGAGLRYSPPMAAGFFLDPGVKWNYASGSWPLVDARHISHVQLCLSLGYSF